MLIKINMFCGDQHRVGQSKKTAALQSKAAGQIGGLLVDDVAVSELFFKVSISLMSKVIPTALVTRKMQLSIKLSVSLTPRMSRTF